jgi:hypothetical protein
MDMGPREGGHESQEAFVLSELLNPLRCHPEPPKAAKDLLDIGQGRDSSAFGLGMTEGFEATPRERRSYEEKP